MMMQKYTFPINFVYKNGFCLTGIFEGSLLVVGLSFLFITPLRAIDGSLEFSPPRLVLSFLYESRRETESWATLFSCCSILKRRAILMGEDLILLPIFLTGEDLVPITPLFLVGL